MTGSPAPGPVFPSGLPEERTSQAWERTAVAVMVAGLLLARYAVVDHVAVVAVIGIGQTVAGAGLLVWAGARSGDGPGAILGERDLVHPSAVRLLGIGTTICLAAALVLALTHDAGG